MNWFLNTFSDKAALRKLMVRTSIALLLLVAAVIAARWYRSTEAGVDFISAFPGKQNSQREPPSVSRGG